MKLATRPLTQPTPPCYSRSAFEWLFMCRFSDAGNDGPCTRWGGRRVKSAKARNRGK